LSKKAETKETYQKDYNQVLQVDSFPHTCSSPL